MRHSAPTPSPHLRPRSRPGGAPVAADASRSSPGEVVTARLRVVPATVDLARAEVRAPGALGELLGATVPDDWPPETVGDAVEWLAGRLEERPEDAGWMHWYAVAGTDRTAIVVGSVSFFG